MKKDGRQHDRKTQEAIRMMAMKRIAEGEDVTTVMGRLGLCRTHHLCAPSSNILL
jgi:hypothetical protein